MQDSMYSAMFGALTQEHRMNIIANNLANVNTTGFKKDHLAFKDVFISFAHDVLMEPVTHTRAEPLFPDPIHIAKPRIAESRTGFEQGTLRLTGGPLDVGIAGEGFFKVQTEYGEFLTRNGNFHVSAEGQLVTAGGEPVLGQGGPITLPQGAESVFINGAGEIFSGDQLVDRFQVVTLDNLQALEKQGQNLFRVKNGMEAAEQPAEDAVVEQGYLETSNVNVVEEMVNMIEAQRQFEAYAKVMKTTDEMDLQAIQKVGKGR